MATMQRVGTTATSITRHDGILRVTYHGTDVVTVGPNGSVGLSTGGWRTVTTKARMNQASNQFDLGYTVYQEKGDWFVAIRRNGMVRDWDNPIPFGDSQAVTFTPER